jgi:hypothetical protein
MGLFRSLILRFVSEETAAAMEAESREWILGCKECPREISVWDLGGIRYKAKGTRTFRARCPQCGRRTSHRMQRRPGVAQ